MATDAKTRLIRLIIQAVLSVVLLIVGIILCYADQTGDAKFLFGMVGGYWLR